MNIDIKVIVFQMINTLILFFVLKKIFFKPVTEFLNERQETIKNKIDRTEEDMKEATLLKQEYQDKLQDAEAEALAIKDSASTEGEERKAAIIVEARKEAEKIKERASAETEMEKNQALAYLRDQVAELVNSATSAVIENSINAENQAALVESYLDKLGNSDEK